MRKEKQVNLSFTRLQREFTIYEVVLWQTNQANTFLLERLRGIEVLFKSNMEPKNQWTESK